MREYRLFIGLKDKHGKKIPNALQKLERILNIYLEAYTLYKGVGVWKKNKEPSAIVEVLADGELELSKLVEDIKIELNQEAIFITEREINGRLV